MHSRGRPQTCHTLPESHTCPAYHVHGDLKTNLQALLGDDDLLGLLLEFYREEQLPSTLLGFVVGLRIEMIQVR